EDHECQRERPTRGDEGDGGQQRNLIRASKHYPANPRVKAAGYQENVLSERDNNPAPPRAGRIEAHDERYARQQRMHPQMSRLTEALKIVAQEIGGRGLVRCAHRGLSSAHCNILPTSRRDFHLRYVSFGPAADLQVLAAKLAEEL